MTLLCPCGNHFESPVNGRLYLTCARCHAHLSDERTTDDAPCWRRPVPVLALGLDESGRWHDELGRFVSKPRLVEV